VYAQCCNRPDEFYRELEGGYTFALVSSRLIKEAVDKIRELGLSTTPIFLADPGDMVSHNNIPMLLMPAYAVPLANVLNNRTVFERRQRKRVRFIVPGARILIVDDSATNLKVAEGLLSLYRAKIDTCFDGRTALDLVMKNEYDLVFMDHTMPEMDGIQATAEIRGMLGPRFKTMPIIALTANAIAGMREMFLANGFNDYLSKPIEVAKLDEIIAKWIPREKQIITGDSDTLAPAYGDIRIEGLDIAKGMSLVAAETWADYAEILQIFCRDAEKRIDQVRQSLESGDLAAFAAQMHSLKGDSATIGADAVSQAAKELELAGKAGDLELIQGSIGQFNEEVILLTGRIKAGLEG
jgi:CheY-like chemotaxis protein/HPt (histidine-containing phosphotransfer) domain-containing protein